ncbi:MAG: hypothetical protein AAGG11_13125 [Pseudomonadota bacterium]
MRAERQPLRVPAPESGPASRRRSRVGGSRLLRTLLLGTAALAAGLFALQRYLELDAGELLGYAGVSLLFVLLPLLAALVCFGAFRLLRKAFDRRP